jgi:CBS domain-containing protein
VLATATRRLRPRLRPDRRRNLEAAQAIVTGDRRWALGGLALFALSPVPSAQLFVAAGLLDVKILPLTAAFFSGRLVSYTLYVGAATTAEASLGAVVSDSLTSPLGIGLQIAMIVAVVALVRIDWAGALAKRRGTRGRTMNSDTPTPGPSIVERLEGRTLREYASGGVLACTPDAPLTEVAGVMATNRVHAVIVADDEVPEPPVISDLDLTGALASGHFEQLRARDVAGADAISMSESDSLAAAAQKLAESRASHVIVRNDRRYPVGIFSTHDLAVAISEAS